MIYHGLYIFVFKTVDGRKQYAEVLVKVKLGQDIYNDLVNTLH